MRRCDLSKVHTRRSEHQKPKPEHQNSAPKTENANRKPSIPTPEPKTRTENRKLRPKHLFPCKFDETTSQMEISEKKQGRESSGRLVFKSIFGSEFEFSVFV